LLFLKSSFLLPQFFEHLFIFVADMRFLIPSIFFLDGSELLPDGGDSACDFGGLSLQALGALDQEDGQPCHSIGLVDQLQESTEGDDEA
jgi:hypothetical protein